jgi:hypothetical protein
MVIPSMIKIDIGIAITVQLIVIVYANIGVTNLMAIGVLFVQI